MLTYKARRPKRPIARTKPMLWFSEPAKPFPITTARLIAEETPPWKKSGKPENPLGGWGSLIGLIRWSHSLRNPTGDWEIVTHNWAPSFILGVLRFNIRNRILWRNEICFRPVVVNAQYTVQHTTHFQAFSVSSPLSWERGGPHWPHARAFLSRPGPNSPFISSNSPSLCLVTLLFHGFFTVNSSCDFWA